MYATICGRFCLNKGGVAGYVNRMKVKYTAKWGVQIAGMIFKTHSSIRDSKFIFNILTAKIYYMIIFHHFITSIE